MNYRLGPQGTPPVVAADLGLSPIVSGLGVWCVILCAIVCFSRARTNLLALFVTTVQVSGREIVWRPMVPFANAVWLPKICNDLWRASDATGQDAAKKWSLPRYWSIAFLCTYSIGSLREILFVYLPQRAAVVLGASVALDAGQIVTAALTYAVLAGLLARVRNKQDDGRSTPHPALASGSASSDLDVLVDLRPCRRLDGREHRRCARGGRMPLLAGAAAGGGSDTGRGRLLEFRGGLRRRLACQPYF